MSANSVAARPHAAEHHQDPALRVACFAIQAESDPGLLPRVLELFAKRGLVPDRWISQREGQRNDQISIDVQVAGFTPELTAYVANCLRQIPQVTSVLTSEKITA